MLGCRRKHRKLGLGFASLPAGIFGAVKKVPGKRDIPVPSGTSGGDNKDKEEDASKESNSKEAKPKDAKSKEAKPKDAKSKPAEKEESKPKKPGMLCYLSSPPPQVSTIVELCNAYSIPTIPQRMGHNSRLILVAGNFDPSWTSSLQWTVWCY